MARSHSAALSSTFSISFPHSSSLPLSLILAALQNLPLSLSRKFNLYFACCRKVCNAFYLLTFRNGHGKGTKSH